MKVFNFPSLTIKMDGYNSVAQEPSTLAQLRKLTLDIYSGMNYELNNFARLAEYRQVNCQILMAYCEDDAEMAAWALLSAEPSTFPFWNSEKGFNPEDGLLFEVYVHPYYRKRGIASQLLKIARQQAGMHRLCVCPHDTPSTMFYNNFSHYENKLL